MDNGRWTIDDSLKGETAVRVSRRLASQQASKLASLQACQLASLQANLWWEVIKRSNRSNRSSCLNCKKRYKRNKRTNAINAIGRAWDKVFCKGTERCF